MQAWKSLLRPALLAALLAVAPGWVWSQQPATAAADAVVFAQEELDQLLAPVALYPDTLLMQVLVAATYPLEVVGAERFIRTNPNVTGEALTQAAAKQTWDASVISLLQFPSVITMMNDQLEWTQKLGDAFLSQQSEVMDTVQALRVRAQQAGNLQNSPQQKVVVQEKIIVIEPAQPQVVYVPYYNPTIVYGPWWVPARPPWYWIPPPIYRPPSFGEVIVGGIFWGVAIGIRNEIWNDYRPSWRDRRVTVVNQVNININVNNRPRPGSDWRHNPVHRKGVAYRDNVVRDRVLEGSAIRPSTRPAARPGAVDRLPSRGDDDKIRPRPAAKPPERPDMKLPDRPTGNLPERPAAKLPERPVNKLPERPGAMQPDQPKPRPAAMPGAINPGASRDIVRAQADRGRASREAMRPAPRPAARPAPAPRQPIARPQPGGARPAPAGKAR